MIVYTKYRTADGEIVGRGQSRAENLAVKQQHLPPGVAIIEGAFDPDTHVIVGGAAVERAQAEKDAIVAERAAREYREEVHAERARRIREGTTVSLTGYATPVVLQGRDEDRANLSDLFNVAQAFKAAGSADTIDFRDRDNVIHTLTADQVIELFLAGSSYVSACYRASWDLKAMDPPASDPTDDAHWP